jgi:hypothetical protein
MGIRFLGFVLAVAFGFVGCSSGVITNTPLLSSTSTPSITLQPTATFTVTPVRTTITLMSTPTLAPSPTPTLRPIEEFRLTEFQPLALNYASKTWTITKIAKYNSLGLFHAQIAGCYIREQGGTDVLREFVRSGRLGKIAYSLYAWAGVEPKSYDLMYFAEESSLVSKSNYRPVFSVNIPNDAEQDCVSQVEEVLATLHVATP